MLKLTQDADASQLVLSATAGNLLGSLLTYAMGRGGNELVRRHWLRIDDQALQRAERGFSRWGLPTLLLAWLPIIGDPLCLLAGMLRVRLAWFLLLVGVGKFSRYAALAWLWA